jgi:aminoglycoside 2'-N-acetyltransferase I
VADPGRLLIQVRHTADLDPAVRDAAHDLLFEAFDDMTDADWDHCLGGMHAIALDRGEVIGHAAIGQRRVLHGGRALRAGYVEGVAVRAAWRRRGVARSLMDELHRIADAAYEVSALGATDAAVPFYRTLGWQQWRGPLRALTPSGVTATPDERGAIWVRPGPAALDLDGDLTIGDWRDGDVW